MLAKGLQSLKEREEPRAWRLPATHVGDEVDHYRERAAHLQLRCAQPSLRPEITLDHVDELTLRIDAALNLVEMGARAEAGVKPLILYYACSQLCGEYARAFLDWSHDQRGHGLNCVSSPSAAGTIVKFQQQGSFPRTAAAVFLLTRAVTPFLPLVTYSRGPMNFTAPGELLAEFGNEEVGQIPPEFTVEQLAAFDFSANTLQLRKRHGLHKFDGESSTRFLLDVALLFAGSHMVRYDSLRWKEVLDGKTNALRITFEEVYDRFLDAGVDLILRTLEDPSLGFDRAILPSGTSPYRVWGR